MPRERPAALARSPRRAAAAGRARRPSQTERAYREVKRRILDNELPAGTRMLEHELAALLGTSRTPVREALVRLANEGMVALRSRHGMRVLPVSADDMREIYEILTSLESTAAELAARRRVSAAELAKLEQAIAEMEAALARDDLRAWAAGDERFHLLLVDLGGNRRLRAMVHGVREQAHRVRMLTLGLRPRPSDSNREHAAVVAAIRRGDAEGARRLHRQHRARAARTLLGLLRAHGLTPL